MVTHYKNRIPLNLGSFRSYPDYIFIVVTQVRLICKTNHLNTSNVLSRFPPKTLWFNLEGSRGWCFEYVWLNFLEVWMYNSVKGELNRLFTVTCTKYSFFFELLSIFNLTLSFRRSLYFCLSNCDFFLFFCMIHLGSYVFCSSLRLLGLAVQPNRKYKKKREYYLFTRRV